MPTRKREASYHAPKDQPAASERFSSINLRRLSGSGLRVFIAVTDLWDLGDEERLLVLGMPSRSSYGKWVKAVTEHREITLSVDRLIRISIILGIHQALGILYATEAEGIAWLRTPHNAPLFGGRPPISLVTSGTQDGPMSVRRFLDAACGGLYMPPNQIDLAFQQYNEADVILA